MRCAVSAVPVVRGRWIVAWVVAAALAGVLTAAPSAEAARGTACGSISVKNMRDGATRYKVYRRGGSCRTARRIMDRWAANTYRTASRNNCANSLCTNARDPRGYTCTNTSAGEESTTGLVQRCKRGRREFRSYTR